MVVQYAYFTYNSCCPTAPQQRAESFVHLSHLPPQVSWDATFAGQASIASRLLQNPQLATAVLWTLPLLLSLSAAVAFSDKLPALKEVKQLFEASITPGARPGSL